MRHTGKFPGRVVALFFHRFYAFLYIKIDKNSIADGEIESKFVCISENKKFHTTKRRKRPEIKENKRDKTLDK